MAMTALALGEAVSMAILEIVRIDFGDFESTTGRSWDVRVTMSATTNMKDSRETFFWNERAFIFP